MFAVSLLLGYTLRGIPIKVSTVRSYLAEAAAVVMDVPSPPPDPQYAQPGRRFESLEAILVFAKSLEDEPNRREPLTPAMLRQDSAPVPTNDPAFLRRPAAIHDWLHLGICTGFRASEWI